MKLTLQLSHSTKVEIPLRKVSSYDIDLCKFITNEETNDVDIQKVEIVPDVLYTLDCDRLSDMTHVLSGTNTMSLYNILANYKNALISYDIIHPNYTYAFTVWLKSRAVNGSNVYFPCSEKYILHRHTFSLEE